MIVVCEPVCQGLEHVPFNAGLLAIIRTAFPDQEICFFAELSHLGAVRDGVGRAISESIRWNPLNLPKRHAEFFSRLGGDARIMNTLMHAARATDARHLVLTTATPSILLMLKFFLKKSRKPFTAQVVNHGILTSLTGWRSRNPFIRMTDYRSALTCGSDPRIQYIVLEESIQKKLIALLPSLKNQVELLEHPIPPGEKTLHRLDLAPPVCFGYLGLVNETKGFSSFNDVAGAISKEYPGRAQFHVIGHLPKSTPKYETPYLEKKPSQTKLPRDEFIRGLSQLHYVCLPFKKEHYELCASGVLLDAITYEKPVLARRLPIFENIFERFGDIGYLFANQTEFQAIIEKIVVNPDPATYGRQMENLKKVRMSRAPEALALQYKTITLGVARSLGT